MWKRQLDEEIFKLFYLSRFKTSDDLLKSLKMSKMKYSTAITTQSTSPSKKHLEVHALGKHRQEAKRQEWRNQIEEKRQLMKKLKIKDPRESTASRKMYNKE